MKRFALLTVTLAACSGSFDASSVAGPENTIQVTGNVSACPSGIIDFASCYAILDNQFKLLYERNNELSRRGESLYRSASNSNNELAVVFTAATTTVTQAIAQLDKFINEITRAYSQGQYSTCAATQLLARAQWLRALLVAGSVDVSNPTPFDCQVSPVIPTATGSASAGVTLTINDPWDFNGDTNYGFYYNPTQFIIEVAVGTGPFTPFLTTVPAAQAGATIFTILDPAANQIGVTYTYRITQCAFYPAFVCSAPATTSVTITTTVPPLCVHDNRNGNWVDNKTNPKCDEKADKIFKNK